MKWSGCVTSPTSSLFSDGDSSGSEDTLSPCERPKGESWDHPGLARDGEKAGHLTMFGASLPCSGITCLCLDPRPSILPAYPPPGSPSGPSLHGQSWSHASLLTALYIPIAPQSELLSQASEGLCGLLPVLALTTALCTENSLSANTS